MALATRYEISPRVRQEARRAMAGYPSRVVHIGGVSRSGTTVLELLLTDRIGAVGVGEVRHVFQRGIIENQRCSCGRAFWECHWWAPAAEAVFGPREKAHARATKVLEQQWSLVRRYPAVRSRRSPRLADYEAVVADLHTVLAEQAGGRWIVDSSKDPAWTEVVGRVVERTEVVHLVRDPRGVVASNRRAVTRPEIVDREELMPRRGALRTVAEWTTFNLLAASTRGVDGYRMLRYEDLCAEPDLVLARLARELEPARAARRPPVFHSVSGNPVRFRVTDPSSMTVCLDDGWRAALSPAEQLAVRAATWPVDRLLEQLGRRATSTAR